jgi:hypothetical protein
MLHLAHHRRLLHSLLPLHTRTSPISASSTVISQPRSLLIVENTHTQSELSVIVIESHQETEKRARIVSEAPTRVRLRLRMDHILLRQLRQLRRLLRRHHGVERTRHRLRRRGRTANTSHQRVRFAVGTSHNHLACQLMLHHRRLHLCHSIPRTLARISDREHLSATRKRHTLARHCCTVAACILAAAGC